VIANGYRLAAEESINILKKMGMKVEFKDDKMLRSIATTAMTGKSVGPHKDYLAEITVRAVKAVSEKKNGKWVVDIEDVKVEKKNGGSIQDTTLVEGIILDKERVHPRMPTIVKNAKIALIDSALEIKKTEVDAKIQITDPSQLQKFLDEEERTLKKKADIIKKSGATVVVCQKGIDDLVQHFLAKENIFAVRRVKKSDMEKLAKATGAKLVTNLEDLRSSDLGFAGTVEEKKIADSDMTFVTGCKDAKSVSLLIRGGTEHVIDEAERALHDALKVTAVAIEDGICLPGGGSMEIELSQALTKYGSRVGGREQLAIEAFSKATEIIPWTLAENAGLDAIDVLIQLRSEHEGKKHKSAGINVTSGKVVDMAKENVIEPLRVKTQAINAATEVAIMILRIDDVIAAKKGAGGPPPGGMPPGGMGGGMDY
jgi:chaperonin GroEL (HSP60 family)